jgi:hypothetical protein
MKGHVLAWGEIVATLRPELSEKADRIGHATRIGLSGQPRCLFP